MEDETLAAGPAPTCAGWDATHANLHLAPKIGQPALYITGSPDIAATAADLATHPTAVRIDQSPAITGTDVLADFFDLENGALTLSEIARVVRDGQAAFRSDARPGQRWPGVYVSRSGVTSAVNALIAGGVTSCPLGVADWNNDLAQATAEVAGEYGPFPIVWRQYANRGAYDLGVFSVRWLDRVSGKVTPPSPLEMVGVRIPGGEVKRLLSHDGGTNWS